MTLREAIDGFQMDNVLLVGQEDGIVERNIMAIKALEVMDSQRWIPVEEQLPEEHGAISDKVLITQGVADKQISFGWLRSGTWVTSDMHPFAKQELITHWMPLPSIPQN